MFPVALENGIVSRPINLERDRVDLRLEPDIRQRMEFARGRFAESLSAYIRRAILERLERDEAAFPPPKQKKP